MFLFVTTDKNSSNTPVSLDEFNISEIKDVFAVLEITNINQNFTKRSKKSSDFAELSNITNKTKQKSS